MTGALAGRGETAESSADLHLIRIRSNRNGRPRYVDVRQSPIRCRPTHGRPAVKVEHMAHTITMGPAGANVSPRRQPLFRRRSATATSCLFMRDIRMIYGLGSMTESGVRSCSGGRLAAGRCAMQLCVRARCRPTGKRIGLVWTVRKRPISGHLLPSVRLQLGPRCLTRDRPGAEGARESLQPCSRS